MFCYLYFTPVAALFSAGILNFISELFGELSNN